ncbi:MAG: MBL fold metallo-hydrolase [Bacteroidales bacterium]|nr:MBL fold metallo-hydrolase [Bacteroidales bacterium]MDP2235789.1 MBL fold metallo-hydrolase [Bacteroidales bacterium]
MKNTIFMISLIFLSVFHMNVNAQKIDFFETSAGKLEIHHVGHSSLMFSFDGQIVHIDPYSRVSDYSQLPKADLILITHQHRDHLDTAAINKIHQENTQYIVAPICLETVSFEGEVTVIGNGESTYFGSLKIEAVPAYNIVNKRDNGIPYHPKGEGNGYILTVGDKRIYVAGDTENIPEMSDFGKIDIAFLPMNLPFTMSPEMTAEAAKAVQPAVLFPYHYGKTDTNEIIQLLKNSPEIEIRIR